MSLTLRIPGDSCRADYPGAICACRWPSITNPGEFRCHHPDIEADWRNDNLIPSDDRPRWCPFGRDEMIVTFSTRKVEDSDGY